MFKSKRISLVTIFAMLVSSMSFVGLSATAANAALPGEFQSIKINNQEVEINNNTGSVTVAPDVTSVNLQVLSSPVMYIDAKFNGVTYPGVAVENNPDRQYSLDVNLTNLKFGSQQVVITPYDDNNRAGAGFPVYLEIVRTNLLSSLTINGSPVVDGATVDLLPYTSSVEVAYVAATVGAEVTVVGGTSLTVGDNALAITVTEPAVDGVPGITGTYNINLKVAASNVATAVVAVNGTDVAADSDIVVPWGTSSVAVVVTQTDSNATYAVTGNTNLKTGNNELSVVVTAPDGVTTQTYNYNVIVSEPYTVLTVNGTAVVDGSIIQLDPYTPSVDVVATPADVATTVVIDGGTELQVGENTLTVTFTDANNVSAVYTITLNVAASTDTAATITINGEEVTDGDTYQVPWGTSSVAVVVVTNDVNATYFLDGDLDLVTGDNALTVLVTAADGVTTLTYTFNVEVLLNTDTSLNTITVNGTPIADGDFIDLDPLTTDVTVEVDPVDTDATVEIIGGTDLVPGNNDLTVIVTAADGVTTLEINVVLNVLPNIDASLSVFTVAGVEVADADYVTVDPLTTEVEVVVETTDPDATYEVVGGTDLVAGENELTVTVVAADEETTSIYTVIIVVAPNTDTTLESFTVNGEDTDDGGVVYVPPFTEAVDVEVVPTDPDATFLIDGNENLVVGDNTLTVIVTAADQETSQEYLVTIVVAPSNDASFQNINLTYDSVDGPQTVSVVDGDEVELPSKTYSVEVAVETTDPESTYEVTGNEDLGVGENELVIVVTAPDGEATEEVYVTLIVAVGDVTTASFTVNDVEVADGDVIDLEPGTESVEIAVELTDPDATYEITGGESLVLGANELVLAVTSVDESLTVEYRVTLNVLPYTDATATIEINGIAWESEEQIIEVDAGDIDVAVNLNNEFATYEITNGDLTDFSGLQVITVEVTAQDGETREVYNASILASSDIEIVPGSSAGDGELRVGSWIKLPRAQFDKQAKLSYVWIRNFEEVAVGSAKYKLTVDDFGADLRVAVGVWKAGDTAPSRIIVSRAIEVAKGLIAKAPTPAIKGKAAVGNTLTATTKDWPEGAELVYQWYRDGDAIDGANGDSYELTAEDFEASISVGITGTIDAYEPLEKVSTGVTIAAGTLRYSDKPAISGDFVTGGTVTVNPGTWLEGAEISIVWLRNGEEIATTTAEENSYVLTSEDYRTRLGVNIVVTADGYKDATFKIKGRSIKIGTFADAPVPTISGDALVGETLEADAGEYPEGAEFTYVWKRNGRVISKANESSYTVTARDAGTTITVRVIAKIPGYKTVRIESEGVEALNAQ